ncbi:BglG family transcription antiterminator [Niallia nealsonii]|uniref:PRD domain-containing protein n=1 Tax=Niallia nealsonii TaxID=115979 RepID=A0A2N0Z5D9_9BACI|nr:PRD domain-containing protein [Niallia nealsonii]PKG24709.1 hypothetical protein CWS01_05520 [Niallia nealsonii]
MNERQYKIIEILQKERRYVTASELAEKLSVSKKTIYRDIQEIVETDPTEYKIRKKENFGYFLEFYEKSRWNEDQFDHPEERRLNLLLFLLSIAPNKTSIQKIADRYFVSQSSIMNDFKHIEKKISPFNLHLSRKNDGTFIEGDQLSIYRIMSVIIESYLTQTGDLFSQYDIPDSIKDIKVINARLMEIKELLHDFQEKHDLLLDQPYYLTLFCSLLSIIEKHTNNLQLVVNDENMYEEIDKGSAIYKMTKNLVDKLEALYFIQLKPSESYYLYSILKAYKLNSRFLLNQDTEKIMNEQVEMLAEQLIQKVAEKSGYQFIEDKELTEQLTLHLHSMVYRLNHQIYIINPIIKSIKSNFANIFNLVKYCTNELNKEGIYDKFVTEEEIGYITLYFQISYDERFANKIPILIECTSGIGTSHLLSEKIKKNFPNILIKKIIAQQRIKKSDYDDVELVISTVKTHSIIDKPTILVSPILNEEDKYKINQFIKNYYQQQVILSEY